MEKIDAAYLNFKRIISEIDSYKDSIFTEQDARVKIIDRILTEVLGFSFEQFITEPPSGGGFIDYKVSLAGLAKLIIEAKRDGSDFIINNEYSGRALLLNGPVFKDKGLKDGLAQTVYYAGQEGAELGCLTNGRTWIIFRANRGADGKKVFDGKGYVFSSLESIDSEFRLFYELLSLEFIQKNYYRAIFQEAEGNIIRTKSFSKVLKNEESLRIMSSKTYSNDLDRVMDTFFSKLSGDDDPDFLMQCFVETKESQAAEFQLSRISNDLAAKVKAIETAECEVIQEIIDRIRTTNKHEFVILIGSKGAGKSTFIDRFFNYILSSHLKEDCIIVKVNLANYKGSETDIINWLEATLLEECEKTLYNGAPTSSEIQGIYYSEYQRLKKAKKVLYEADKTKFKIEFSEHIETRRETRPTEYIQNMIGNIVKSRKKIPCIIFDNTDHFTIKIQELVFQYARAIYEKEVCLVIVPITDKTSWQLSKSGAIQSYESEALFLPTPPPQKVIENRIKYIENKVANEKRVKGSYFLTKGIKLEIRNLEGFALFLQKVFLQDRKTSKWIGALSNFDTRRCLDLSKDLITSPHLSIDEFLVAYSKSEVEQELPIDSKRIKRALIKKNYTSYPINHHSFIQNMFYLIGIVDTSPILSLRILQLFIDRKSDTTSEDYFLSLDQILSYFNAMGADRSITLRHLEYLLRKGLINSYDPTVLDIEIASQLEITPSGREHYIWALNDYDYIYSMIEVTLIVNSTLYEELFSGYYFPAKRNILLSKFLDDIIKEDKEYITIPAHDSYKGQNLIIDTLTKHINSLKK